MNLGRILFELRSLGAIVTTDGEKLFIAPAGESPLSLPKSLTDKIRTEKPLLILRLRDEQGPYHGSIRAKTIADLYDDTKATQLQAVQSGDRQMEAAMSELRIMLMEWHNKADESWDQADRWEAENAARLLELREVRYGRKDYAPYLEDQQLVDTILDTFPGAKHVEEPPERQEEAA